MNLANRLTLIRIAAIPVFIVCFYIPSVYRYLIAATVFILAYITDIFDGRYARKHNLVTDFGKLMDPIADKLLTSSALVFLTAENMVSPICTFIIIAREFIISAMRLIALEKGKVIAASGLGKIKTVSQCVAISAVLISPSILPWITVPTAVILTWAAAGLTLWSGLDYIIKNAGLFKDGR